MTQEIIELARQSGWTDDLLEVSFVSPMLEAFAKLVAAKEREACAKLCEQHPDGMTMLGGAYMSCATTIRARGEALAKEKTLQALHSENERLGLYKDAYAQRTWVDLTRTQMQDVYFAVLEEHRGGHQMEGQLAFGEALQAKIKERNT